MSDLARAAEHQAFRVERAGDLLIVTPVGDPIEFSLNLFQSEFARVKRLAALPEFRNVLIDMSNSSYFGSEMIGMLIDLRRTVAAKHGISMIDSDSAGGSIIDGGVVALAGVSPDMAAGLKIMTVDQLFLTFDSRSQGVSAIASIPFSERLKVMGNRWVVLAILFAVVFVASIFVLIPVLEGTFGAEHSSDFQLVQDIYEQWNLKQKNSLGQEEISRGTGPLLAQLEEVVQRSRGSESTHSYLYVGDAAGHLANWIRSPANSRHPTAFALAMTAAAEEIKKAEGKRPTIGEALAALISTDDSDTPEGAGTTTSGASHGADASLNAARAHGAEPSPPAASPPSENDSAETPESDSTEDETSRSQAGAAAPEA